MAKIVLMSPKGGDCPPRTETKGVDPGVVPGKQKKMPDVVPKGEDTEAKILKIKNEDPLLEYQGLREIV